MPVPRDLPRDVISSPQERALTSEQLEAVERREGLLFLDAGAGSGKTSVLVERFVRSVLEDGIDVSAILTITFTEKAAAEMRERIRGRLRELGALEEARATEGAFISTIHGFCARLLRANSLAAGIDPSFTVLDEPDARRLADEAFDAALQALAEDTPGGVELISAYGAGPLRAAIQAVHAELRSRGQTHPVLPPVSAPGEEPGIETARLQLESAAAAAAAELGEIRDPAAKVVQALAGLERCAEVLSAVEPWPADAERLQLPSGNGAALSTPVCVAYREAVERYVRACERRWTIRARDDLDRLLGRFAERYAELKRRASGLDFEDLELLSRDLLREDTELRDRYRSRFERVMVDELQDTNAVQLELIDAVSGGNLFTVGDAQQSIYAFRHADVELFERRGAEADAAGARATLRTNFRSRPEILEVINRAFGDAGGREEPLVPGREEETLGEPRVELLVADKGADWSVEGPAAPWRVAEARALARRVEELIGDGAAPGDVVVLLRATGDMRTYERALEERGVPTYVIGGRGYWSHPQVVDLIAYLRTLANPRDELALYGALASPLVGASVDALVLLGAAARAAGRNVWWVLDEPGDLLGELSEEDRSRLEDFVSWVRSERTQVARRGVEELIERVLERTGYDLEVLAMPGGGRRLANVRKLMRLGREHEALRGPDLRGFLELAGTRAAGARDPRESEAPVESEGLDAVRIMTIHRAKGLEFEIVCVADLGRAPWWSGQLIRVGRDGRLGLRLSRPGSERPWATSAHTEIGDELKAAEAAEERRLFYVAMTRARERLILSGAAKLGAESWGNGSGPPMGWLGPAVIPGITARVEEGSGVAEGVRFTFVTEDEPPVPAHPPAPEAGAGELERPAPADRPQAGPSSPPVHSLSYTSLTTYLRCGYRFYAERVLGLPPAPERTGEGGAAPGAGLTAAERGSAVHALLERLDFKRPLRPSPEAIAAAAAKPPGNREATEIAALVERFGSTEICARLGRAVGVRREQPFAFPLGPMLITGALDVIASEPGGTLVVDYKSDRLEGSDPGTVVEREYRAQRLIYALAALRSGAERVEVTHVFLQAPDHPVSATYERADQAELERELSALAGGIVNGDFGVTEIPHREICQGCPAEGGLCSWPLDMTRRSAPDTLF